MADFAALLGVSVEDARRWARERTVTTRGKTYQVPARFDPSDLASLCRLWLALKKPNDSQGGSE